MRRVLEWEAWCYSDDDARTTVLKDGNSMRSGFEVGEEIDLVACGAQADVGSRRHKEVIL